MLKRKEMSIRFQFLLLQSTINDAGRTFLNSYLQGPGYQIGVCHCTKYKSVPEPVMEINQ